MGCGCGGKKTVMSPPSGNAATPQALAPRTYDVVDSEGALVASTTNIVFARVEARRTGGTVVPRQTTLASQA